MQHHHSAITIHGAKIMGAAQTSTLSFVDGRITTTPPADAWQIDLRDHLVFPGLVNAHDHLHLNNVPPLPPHAPFPNSYAWIEAFQPYFREPGVAAAVAVPAAQRYWQGGLKNLLCGATTVAHHDPWHSVLDDAAFPVRLLRRFGWSHSLGLGAGGRRQSAVSRMPSYGPPVVESYGATPPSAPWIVHLGEGIDEVAARELSTLDALGCLGANTVLVHGVGLSDDDVARVIDAGAGVVWCPGSNTRILGRTLNPRRLFDAGRLALGSDSRIAGSFDMLGELRAAAEVGVLTPQELLHTATAGGAHLLRMKDVGGLAPGQRADLVIVRDNGGDPHRALLHAHRADLVAVVRDGVPTIAGPQFAEWFKLCDIQIVPVLLDGCPKLLAANLAQPEAMELELGLERLKDEG